MSGEDGAALAQILETAGQRAEEIRSEIANLKEKTGSNAVTVPQLLKGDAVPDVTEPAEAGRPDEPDGSLQFTVSTPSGERQAPPKTEDGTDTEDLDRTLAVYDSPIQVYVRSGQSPGKIGEATWACPGLTAVPEAAAAAAVEPRTDAPGQPDAAGGPGSWQGLYHDMVVKLNKTQSLREQSEYDTVAEVLKSAGMASAVDTTPCNVRAQQMATPFAVGVCQAAAIAAGAITSQQSGDDAFALQIEPSPVHVVDGPYQHAENAECTAHPDATSPVAAVCLQGSDADAGHTAGAGTASSTADCDSWTHSPSWLVTPEPKSSASSVTHTNTLNPSSGGGADGVCTLYEPGGHGRSIVVPASAADLPVQAVLQELDELLQWSGRTPTQQQPQQQDSPGKRLFALDRDLAAKSNTGSADTQAEGTPLQDAVASPFAAAAGGQNNLVLKWLQGQKTHLSRGNSTSCLLSDEFAMRAECGSVSSSNNRPRRSSSVPLPSESCCPSAGGAVEGLVVRAQHQKHSTGELRDELLTHLRLAAAFCAQPRPSSSSNMPTLGEPAGAAASGTAAAEQPSCSAQAASLGVADNPMKHGASFVDWVSAGTPVKAAVTAVEASVAGESDASALVQPGVSSFSITCGIVPDDRRVSCVTNTLAAANEATPSPKAKSKPAQLYQQLLCSASRSPMWSSTGNRSRQSSRAGEQQNPGSSVKKGAAVAACTVRGSQSSAGADAGIKLAGSGSGRWSSPELSSGAAASSPLRQASGMSQEHDAHITAASVKCTSCGNPVQGSQAGSKLQHTHMSIADFAAEETAYNRTAAPDGDRGGKESPVATTYASLAALLGSDEITETACCICKTTTASGHSPLGADRSCLQQKSICMFSPHKIGYAAGTRKQAGSYAGLTRQSNCTATAAAPARGSSTDTPVGGYASGGGRWSGTGSSSISRHRGAGSQRSSASGGETSAAGGEPRAAMVTAISCGQLLAAAALEQAIDRVSAGGGTPNEGSMAEDAAAHVGLLQQPQIDYGGLTHGDRLALGQAYPVARCQEAACHTGSVSGLTEQEREMQEQALEEEIAKLNGSTGKAASNVFVYRLHPTNDQGAGNATAAGNSPAAAAAAAAAMQTLAACANRKVPRAASQSPVRMSSAKSSASRESKRSSSSETAPRRGTGSQAVSRSSSAKSSAAAGSSSGSSARVWRPGGSTSAKDESRKLKAFESARSRILGPALECNGSSSQSNSTSARSRILSPAVEGGGNSSRPSSSKPATPSTPACNRANSSPKKPVGKRIAAAVAAIQGGCEGTTESRSEVRPGSKPIFAGRGHKPVTAASIAAGNKSPVRERRAAPTAPPAQAKAQAARVAARTAASTTCRSAAAQASKRRLPAATPQARTVQEQAVQADVTRELLINAASLAALPNVFDACTLLGQLKRRTKRPVRQSTPGRIQSAGQTNAVMPPVQPLHNLQQPSPTTSQVEEAIKAAQVALLQRRWQISQLRKAMEQQYGIHSAGSRSNRSSIASYLGSGMISGSGIYSGALGRHGNIGEAAAAEMQAAEHHDSSQQDEAPASSESIPSSGMAAPLAAVQRSSSAGGAVARLGLGISSPTPIRPRTAQAVVMKAATCTQALQHDTASHFAPLVQQAAPPVALGLGLGSRRSSCSAAPRRRSSLGHQAVAGSAAAGGAALPPWSAPRRVSSMGLTGEELMAYYKRSSAAEALQTAASDTGDLPAPIGLQLDAMVRAYNLVSKRKTVDKTAALAALMAQIVAVANGQPQLGHVPTSSQLVAEPTAGLDARQLLESSTHEADSFAADGTKLDVLGRNMSPHPADLGGLATCGGSSSHADDVCGSKMSPTHCMLQHAASKLGEFASDNCSYSCDSCGSVSADALAAAESSGIVVVHMRITDATGRLLLRDTATGKAVLAGVDGAGLSVQQAVHWLKVGLTRLDQGDEKPDDANGAPVQGEHRQLVGSRVPSPARAAVLGLPGRAGRARSRPRSPFRACFASAADISDEEDELQQQQQLPKQKGVHFEVDGSNQLVMCVPVHLAGGDMREAAGVGVQKYTVTGVALPADTSKQGGYCLELVTCAGRHRIELASARDWAGLLAGLNAMLLLREQTDAMAADKLGAMLIADTTWSAAVEGIVV